MKRVGNHWSLVCYVISCHLFWNTSSDPQSSCIWQLLWRDVLWRRHDMWTWVTKQNCGLFFVIQGRCSNIWFFAGVFSYLGVVCVCVFFQVNRKFIQYEHAVWACSMYMYCRFAQTLMCLFLLPHIWANYKDLSQSQARPPPALSSI